MKKLALILLSILLLFTGCIKGGTLDISKNSENRENNTFLKSSSANNESGYILYARNGIASEICSITPAGKKFTSLYDKECYGANGNGNKILFYSRTTGSKIGIYSFDLSSGTSRLLTEEYKPSPRLTEASIYTLDLKPVLSPGNAYAAYGYIEVDQDSVSRVEIPRVFYMGLNDTESKRIRKITGEIRDVTFLDKDNIIYSKRVYENDKYIYQLYKFSLKEDKETRYMVSGSNDVSPMVSPDGKKIAFLSDRYKDFNLYVLDLNTNKLQEVDSKDAIVDESMVWSQDSSGLVYIASSSVTMDRVKYANISQKTAVNIGDGYIAAFSPSGKNIIFAAYAKGQNGKNGTQEIYKYEINAGKPEKIWGFPESNRYSKSINMLYWTDKLK